MRYHSRAFDPQRLGAVVRYVELNPVRAGLVASAELYPWSSAEVHLGGHDRWGVVATADWNQCWTPDQWRAELRAGEDAAAAIASRPKAGGR